MNKKQTIFLSPLDGDGGGEVGGSPGSAALDPVVPVAGLEDGAQGGAPVTPAAPAATVSAPSAPSAMQLTTEQFQQLLSQTKQGAGAPAQSGMTQEQFDKTFQVFRPTQDHLAKILAGGDDALGALNEVLNGTNKHAVTVAAYLAEDMRRQLDERYAPALSMAEERRNEKLKSEFFEFAPDLKDCEPLLVMAKSKLEQQGFRGSKEEAFKQIADMTRSVMKQINPGTVSQPTGGQKQQQTGTHKMTTVSTGGQGGLGGGGTAGKKSPGAAVFD